MKTASQSVDIQAQIRRNADDQNSFLKDLGVWEKQIKKQEEELRKRSASSKCNSSCTLGSENGVVPLALLPCVAPNPKQSESSPNCDSTGILGEDSNKVGGSPALLPSVATDPKVEETPADIVNEERQRGNCLYSKGQYSEAIKCYTRCLSIDPQSVLAYSNRAMAYIKVKDWVRAESDATSALDIDPMHIKSYQRRSTARLSLGKLRAALKDLHLAEAVASKMPSHHTQKELAADMKRAEAALQAAVRRAPKRDISVVVLQEEEESKVERQSEQKPEDSSIGKVEDEIVLSERSSSPLETSRSSAPASKAKVAASFEKPSTWYQFESVWKSIESRGRRRDFLSTIGPRKIASLYKHGIEDGDLLVEIVVAAAETEEASDYLRCLAGIKAVDMTVMMMSAEHKALVRDAVRKGFGEESARGDAAKVAAKFGC